MGGSAIQKEGEKLKKVVLLCSHEVSEQSCLVSNDKDRSVMSFFLFLDSIRDNPLKVTGGEWSTYKTSEISNLYTASCRYSGASGGSTSFVVSLLCSTIYLIISSLMSPFGSQLNQKFKTQNMSEFLLKEIKKFKSIVLFTEAVDKALNACTFFLYCELRSMIFVTISRAISQEKSFQSDLENYLLPGILSINVTFFYNLTICGSSILD
ncbi:hypothetical protein CEXT_602131 [Caerostris extrusa]|uniref:Uncharacterized protein n=1 Tax=Caerostris extrusa TaxID=172846 RepID=A0AAV4XYN1_CAEEX|nr:hypothetical protein CEXT_602131 [Caerostris extrusa]